MNASTNSFGRGSTPHGNMPPSLHEMEPLTGSVRRLALDNVGVPPRELNAAFVLLGRLQEAGRSPQVLAALLAPSFVHEITPIVNDALDEEAENSGGTTVNILTVDEEVAVVRAK